MAADYDPGIDGLSQFRVIGRGGFSTVYAAWEAEFSRHVAVKVLHHLDEAAGHRFDRERSLMGRTSGHPNVITPIRSGRTADGAPYLVMQYLEGGSLQDLVKRGEIVPWPEAVALLRPIAEALGHSHAAGILHKDVKPANILLAANGTASLSDFGIAGVLGSTATETAFTFAHTPPEAFVGAGDRRDERSDLYSLASTLYTIVVGRSPFAATTEEEEALPSWMYRVANVPVEPTGLDADLDDFLVRSLAKPPDDRPQSATEFLAGLDRLLRTDRERQAVPLGSSTDTSVLTQPEPTGSPPEPTLAPERSGSRPTWVVPVVVGCVVALIASLVTIGVTGLGDRLRADSSTEAGAEPDPASTPTGADT
ncbi:MAG: serine/threonine-protein kinase, partial [Actinomycetota bacterium]